MAKISKIEREIKDSINRRLKLTPISTEPLDSIYNDVLQMEYEEAIIKNRWKHPLTIVLFCFLLIILPFASIQIYKLIPRDTYYSAEQLGTRFNLTDKEISELYPHNFILKNYLISNSILYYTKESPSSNVAIKLAYKPTDSEATIVENIETHFILSNKYNTTSLEMNLLSFILVTLENGFKYRFYDDTTNMPLIKTYTKFEIDGILVYCNITYISKDEFVSGAKAKDIVTQYLL